MKTEKNSRFNCSEEDIAIYKPADRKGLIGNPFYEALPTYEDAYEKLFAIGDMPIITDKERALPDRKRINLLNDIDMGSVYLSRYEKLFDMIYSLIENGYVRRNPRTVEYVRELNALGLSYKNRIPLQDMNKQGYEYAEGTAAMARILGVTGVGKSTAIKEILKLFPKFIVHEQYEGEPLTTIQIPYISIKCPSDSSLTTICLDIFTAVDAVTGENYRAKYGYSTKDISGMVNRIRALGAIYGIGLIVIDELQDLVESGRDTSEVKTFISQLANKSGIPFLLVGTVVAEELFESGSSQRRTVSGGDIIWGAMKNGDKDWEGIIKDLWDLQVVKNPIPLSRELNDSLFEKSQGILFSLKKIFLMSQKLAIETGIEEITLELIQEAYDNELPTIKKLSEAIKNDVDVVSTYGDLVATSTPVNRINGNYQEKHNKIEKIKDTILKNRELWSKELLEKVIEVVQISKIARNLSEEKVERIVTPIIKSNLNQNQEVIIGLAINGITSELNKKSTSKQPRAYNNELEDIRKQMKENGKTGYDILKSMDLISEDL